MAKWALVLGSSGGVGAQVVEVLRDRDVRIAGVDRVAGNAPLDAEFVGDVGSPQMTCWTQTLLKNWGPPQGLTFAAGTYDRIPLHLRADTEIHRVIQDNLLGFTISLASILRATKAFRLAAVSSQAAVHGGTDAVYAASKAGLTALTKSLAMAHAKDGLRANVVSPGPIDTPMAKVMGDRREFYENTIPIGRFSTPREVAVVVVWLLMDAPDAISGAVIDVDGGLIRR